MTTRREFITLVGGAAAWPTAAQAQQAVVPVIGFLNGVSPEGFSERLRAFRRGLKEMGYAEGENVLIEYRWAENQFDRLAPLAADLLRRQVAVIVTSGNNVAPTAAKAATSRTPIVFGVSGDPVKLGIVPSLARPAGNATGVNFFSAELLNKRLGLLRELVPGAAHVAVLINAANASGTETTLKELRDASPDMTIQIQTFSAGTASEIHTAFEGIARERPQALFIANDAFFFVRRVQLATLAARHGFATSFPNRESVEAGGLMSYGTDINDAHRQMGVYTGRILKGEKPADLPVVQSIKFELVINLVTAKALGIDVPPMLLARADEVIE